MAVQAQWSLDTTAGSAFSLLSGVIQAATTDNVQAIALLACERFGSTLAMSDETMSKIETSVVPTPPSIPLRFLQATIGFSKHDCAAQLGKSKAGVRFLGLAAALITTMEPFQAAKALDLMLSKSAADPTQLPTLRQLRELLLALDPRCLTAGFADSVHGWELLMTYHWSQRAHKFQAHHPPPDCLGLVVDSFRQIGRIGDADITDVTIKTARCGAWLIAFTKWCLGAPPSVYFEDGTSIIEQPESPVRIYIIKEGIRDVFPRFTIQTHRSLDGLNELVLPELGSPCLGMVSVDVFGQRLLDRVDSGSKAYRQALVAAVSYATCQALSNISFGPYTKTGLDPRLVDQFGISPFPKRQAVETAMNLVLGPNNATKLKDLEEHLTLRDIPVVSSLLDKKRCRCTHSSAPTCECKIFLGGLSLIVSVILGVSLFRWPEDLKLDIGHLRDNDGLIPSTALRLHKFAKAAGRMSPNDVLDYVCKLVGHPDPKKRRSQGELYVASSMRGQVVYPTIFETLKIQKHGFLSFDHHRGKLMYKNDEYSSVIGAEQILRGSTFDSPSSGRPVDRPCNLFPGYRVSWGVSVAENTLMVDANAAEAGKDTSSSPPGMRLNPAKLLARAGYIFMVENCGHGPSSPLTHPSPQWRYTGLAYPENRVKDGCVKRVIAVDGASDLRVFALISPPNESDRFVVRERSCLSCCVEAAEKLDAEFIIL